MAVSRDHEVGYWYNSNTVPDTEDDFFEESCISSSTVGGGLYSREPTTKPTRTPVRPSSIFSGGSILDNITTDDGQATPTIVSPTSQLLTKAAVGRSLGSLGEKIQDWKPSATVRKWSQGGAGERCNNCPRLEREVAQLSNRLQASYSRINVPLPISATIHALLQGLPHSLHPYTSLQDKQALLQAALVTADSDTVVAVVVFLKNTLSRRLFLQELERHTLAVTCYVQHLRRRRMLTEAVEILLATGRREEAGLLRYQQCLQASGHKGRMSALQQLVSQHFTEASSLSAHYQRHLHDHMTLLEQQHAIDTVDGNSNSSVLSQYPRASDVYDRPLLTTLYYCSMYHWDASSALASNASGSSASYSPLTLKLHYRLSDRQYLWAVLRARARVKHYHLPHQLMNLLQNKGGVLGALGGALSSVTSSLGGSGATLRSVLPVDRVVDALRLAGAPDAVLSSYLSLVEPKDLRLRLSLHHGIRPAVVEAYIALKDRDGLQRYMTLHLPPGSADYVKADAALKNGRWR